LPGADFVASCATTTVADSTTNPAHAQPCIAIAASPAIVTRSGDGSIDFRAQERFRRISLESQRSLMIW
jgi:hypothetical protein